MDNTGIFVIVIAIVVVVIVAVVLGVMLSAKARRRAWSEFADSVGLFFDQGGALGSNMKVTGTYRGRQAVLDTFTRTSGTGDNRHTTTYTRLMMTVNNPANVALTLDREGVFSKVGKALGMKDIQTGDSELDKHLIIKGQPEATVRAILSNSYLRQKLLQTRSIDIDVSMNQIHFQKQGFEKNPEVLTSWFDLLASLADAIERQ